MAVVITAPCGVWHKFPVSGTPRDSGAQLNQIRQQVMAWLESIGAAEARGTTGQRKAYRRPRVRSTIHRVEVALDPSTGPARDPWAVLTNFRLNAAK